MGLSKKKVGIILIIFAVISILLKLSIISSSVFPTADTTSYMLNAISYANGDFAPIQNKSPGWPLLVSLFSPLVDSEKVIDYANISRTLSIVISIATILPMYVLSRKFFSEKYSLVATSLFVFEPHLNHNAVLGLAEPLFIMVLIIAVNFILNNNTKYVYLSFLSAGILWWISWPGAMLFFILSTIFFINFKKTPKLFLKYGLCAIIFFFIASPLLIQRYEEYGDPLYFEYGTFLFSEKLVTVSNLIFEMSLPYLIIFIPFGILFSFRPIDQLPRYILANWIIILLIMGLMILSISTLSENRLLLYMYPFLILFSTIPIQRVVKYGLSTFSLSEKQKNLALISVIGIIAVGSTIYGLNLTN